MIKVDPNLVTIAINNLPAAIATVRAAFVKANPTEPAPTSEEIIATFNAVFNSSLVTDEAWLAAHPANP